MQSWSRQQPLHKSSARPRDLRQLVIILFFLLGGVWAFLAVYRICSHPSKCWGQRAGISTFLSTPPQTKMATCLSGFCKSRGWSSCCRRHHSCRCPERRRCRRGCCCSAFGMDTPNSSPVYFQNNRNIILKRTHNPYIISIHP